ncbi:hypothetical protein M1397_03495 [Candidatus Marsarchaeota archaeon]|jgi:tRNA (cytidine56-2'-O)-methyltransferase|nr:hypothetical protein [Candidatus Marsarchaeota archaeon]
MISVLIVGKANYEDSVDMSLIARAFGAANITFSPANSRIKAKLKKHMAQVSKKWGGKFEVDFCNNWLELVKNKRNYIKIYLTRYGIPLRKMTYRITTYKNILLIATTSESVKSVYTNADFNISISSQPHTCGSSLAVFLHDFYHGRELAMHFENAESKVVPSDHSVIVKEAQ